LCDIFFLIRIQLLPHLFLVTPTAGKLANITVNEGADALFNLKITGGRPKPYVKWFLEGVEENQEITVHTGEQYELVQEEDDSFTLKIKSVKIADSRSYYAQLINTAGSLSSNKATLTINSKHFSESLSFSFGPGTA
jgi:hypothetical protein